MTDHERDYPLLEVMETAKLVVDNGGTIFQKWTCQGCGQRVTGDNPNTLTAYGQCQCGHVTNIAKTGCNYMAAMPAELYAKLMADGATPPQSRPFDIN